MSNLVNQTNEKSLETSQKSYAEYNSQTLLNKQNQLQQKMTCLNLTYLRCATTTSAST